MRVQLEPAYVLHTRAYRDTSLLVDIFSREHGRVSLVARGARAPRRKSGGGSALLRPFLPLLCSWSGRSSLKTLTAVEATATELPLRGKTLYCGLYINELLCRLLHHDDAHESLFELYRDSVAALVQQEDPEALLRRFEFGLLEELGYGFDLTSDGHSGEELREEGWYSFHQEYGLVAAAERVGDGSARFSGAQLLALARGENNAELARVAKRLLRRALAAHLGDKPLKSRELFRLQA